MLLIVGLGNPGEKYARTRHNFGFLALDELAKGLDVTFREDKKFKSEVGECTWHDRKIILAKPQTFMNLSGEAVGALARFYKIEPKHIWVIADDLDLPLGKIRVRHNGESGGHHGLESIEQHLGNNDFCRIRMGIRGPETKQDHIDRQIDTNIFVTSDFSEKERPFVEKAVHQAAAIVQAGLKEGSLAAHTYEINGLNEHAGDLTA
jgi:PTH1 family peptidyl-tRNA hydrolase